MKLSDLYAERERILALLEALKKFPNTRTVRQLRRELKEKLEKIELKIEELEEQADQEDEEPVDEDSDKEVEDEADKKRSTGMKKYHRYIRLINDNYPEYSYSLIRSMLSRRKRGEEVDIPDVVWQNPSP